VDRRGEAVRRLAGIHEADEVFSPPCLCRPVIHPNDLRLASMSCFCIRSRQLDYLFLARDKVTWALLLGTRSKKRISCCSSLLP
jgi:hypothetical protein